MVMNRREIVRLPKNVPTWRLLISHFSRTFVLKFCVLSKNVGVQFSLLGFQLEEWISGKVICGSSSFKCELQNFAAHAI
jgi:hypothetical protein